MDLIQQRRDLLHRPYMISHASRHSGRRLLPERRVRPDIRHLDIGAGEWRAAVEAVQEIVG